MTDKKFKKMEPTYRGTIKATYKKYQCFVEKDLPDFNIEFVNPTIDITYKARVLLKRRPIILEINKGYLDKPDFGSVLFHEFTHIYDYVLFEDLSDRYNKLFLYSEYHSAQIEVIKKIKLINKLSDNIDGKDILIHNRELANQLANELNNVSQIYVNKIMSNLENDIKFFIPASYFYYLGVYDLISPILGLSKNTAVEYHTSKKDDYKKIHEKLVDIKYNQKPSNEIIEEISKLY